MRRALLLLVCLVCLCSGPGEAADVCMNVPNAMVSPARDTCEYIRITRRFAADSFGDEQCAEELFRIGLRVATRQRIEAEKEEEKQTEIRQARVTFDDLFPMAEARPGRPDPPRVMQCGDGIVDNDPTIPYVEECDDGNDEDGDGCSATCTSES